MPPSELILTFAVAAEADAAALAALRTAVAERLTAEHGRGHWSSAGTEAGILRAIRSGVFLVGRSDGNVVAMLVLASKKPWAIDPAYFSPARRPLYLTGMGVEPALQGRGIGRRLLEEAKQSVRAREADALRLDAYDGEVGAGEFYAKCGFREVGQVTYRGTPLRYFEWLPTP